MAKRILIEVDKTNKEALNFLEEKFLPSLDEGLKVVRRAKQAELILGFGGDGWALRCIRKYRGALPFLGINFGYKGFLMNDLKPDGNLATLIKEGRYKTFTFPFLEVKGELKNGRTFKDIAVNDVYFNRMTRQTCRLNVKVDGILVGSKIQGDGLIVYSALGSTGYNLAVDGCPVHPTVPIIGLTPVAIHTPIQFIPMVFPIGSVFSVEVLEPEKRKVQATADIKEYKSVIKAEIKKSDLAFQMVLLEGEDFTKRIIEKLMKIPEVQQKR